MKFLKKVYCSMTDLFYKEVRKVIFVIKMVFDSTLYYFIQVLLKSNLGGFR